MLLAAAWFRLESGAPPIGELLAMLGLAVVPAAALALRRGRLVVGGLVVLSTLVAASVAFGIPLTDARPGSDRDFFGPVLSGIHQGFLDFYDTGLPFDRLEFGLMHSLVLLAVFGFLAVTALLLAAGRTVAAGTVLLVGAGWPTTLAPGGQPLLLGALALAGVLAILFLARTGPRPLRGVGSATAVGVVLVVAAIGASTSEAVAKRAFLGWQKWDLYDAPEDPVGVRYVWNSHYQGITFPKKKTVVLKVRVPGKKRQLYWRATTLDEYTGVGWRENLRLDPAARAEQVDELGVDPLLPKAAANETKWVRQDVTVGALSDNHLIASAQPVRWRPGTGAPVQAADSGIVLLTEALRPGQRYTAWSYVPDAKPTALGKAPSLYSPAVARYLELLPGSEGSPAVVFPAWGAQDREARVDQIFREGYENFLLGSYRGVYRKAQTVVRGAKSPYEAALALEAWFRSLGGFHYNEHPPQITTAEPPLVTFVLRSKQGYCQHFAGAMAVMLRLLGVPARVAAGFTSGEYDESRHEWTVTDHNAHTWVEVYFPGFGWLPFDPTPGRGQLSARYSSVSEAFDKRDIGGVVGPLGGAGQSFVLSAIGAEALRSARTGLEGIGGLSGRARGGGAGTATVIKDRGQSLFTLALLVVAVAIAAILAAKLVRRQLRFASRDPRGVAAACRRDLAGFLADQGMRASPAATIADLGALVEHEFVVDAGPFVRTLSLARFGPPAETGQALARARRELRVLRRQMRRELGVASRIRGALSLRSLTV